MKIVLKHKNEVKLYTEELDFEHILNFIQTQFKLSKESLSMTFHDPEGDNITILTNEDFQIMQTILEGKEYVKINVEGLKVETINENEKLITVFQPQKGKQESKQFQKKQYEEQRQSSPIEAVPQNKVDEMSSKTQIQSERICQWRGKQQKCYKMKYVNEMVANLVDQRIKSLLPCLKQQLKQRQESKVQSKNSLIHQGVECKGCFINPIAGIRYKCPKCPNFNLCQKCEDKIQHHHNLLKIKQIQVEEKNQQFPCMRQFFRGCSRREGGQNRQKCGRWGSHHYNTKLQGLSFIFGGQPQAYRDFVQQNAHLYPRQTFMTYAKSIGMPQDLFRNKFVMWRCQQLSSYFGKPAQVYKSFVEENYDLKYREMLQLLYQRGIQKREEKPCWKGKQFDFNKFNQESQKEQIQAQKCKRGKSYGFNIDRQQQKIEVSESILRQPKPLDCPEVNRAKGRLFMNIKNLFPNAENKEIYKFVDQNYKQDNEEEVTNLWIERCFGK